MERHGTTSRNGSAASDREWSCPVCGVAVAHPYRPGRARVYCTNACRQRAYRWRCRRRGALHVAPPPQRAHSERTHALRADADLVTPLTDGRGRRVTACGTFARAARDHPDQYHHRWFFSTTTAVSTCRRCVAVLGVPTRPIAEVLAQLHPAIFGAGAPLDPTPRRRRAAGSRRVSPGDL